MKIIKVNLANLSPNIVKQCVSVLKNGGVIVVPTDTVYGLICDATNRGAVKKIFRIKKRNFDKPIGVFVRSITMAAQYVKINQKQKTLLKTAQTFIFPLKQKLPYQKKTLGVRLPKSSLILKIIYQLGFPLAQTSANLSGQPLGNDIESICWIFGQQENKPDLILDAGRLLERKASKVIDVTKDKKIILRD